MPKGERRMWGIGLRVTCPPSNAVRSPPHLAASEWAASWQVVESRKATYQTAPRAMAVEFTVIGSNAVGYAALAEWLSQARRGGSGLFEFHWKSTMSSQWIRYA